MSDNFTHLLHVHSLHLLMIQFAEANDHLKLLVKLKGPEVLVSVLKHGENTVIKENLALLKALTTAVWKLSSSIEARNRFRQLGIVSFLIRQLSGQTEEVHLYLLLTRTVILCIIAYIFVFN